jgi:hypothetical protein
MVLHRHAAAIFSWRGETSRAVRERAIIPISGLLKHRNGHAGWARRAGTLTQERTNIKTTANSNQHMGQASAPLRTKSTTCRHSQGRNGALGPCGNSALSTAWSQDNAGGCSKQTVNSGYNSYWYDYCTAKTEISHIIEHLHLFHILVAFNTHPLLKTSLGGRSRRALLPGDRVSLENFIHLRTPYVAKITLWLPR